MLSQSFLNNDIKTDKKLRLKNRIQTLKNKYEEAIQKNFDKKYFFR